jgi:hypothetical protein
MQAGIAIERDILRLPRSRSRTSSYNDFSLINGAMGIEALAELG